MVLIVGTFQKELTRYLANCINNLLTITFDMQNSVKHIVSKLLVLHLFSKILFYRITYNVRQNGINKLTEKLSIEFFLYK